MNKLNSLPERALELAGSVATDSPGGRQRDQWVESVALTA